MTQDKIEQLVESGRLRSYEDEYVDSPLVFEDESVRDPQTDGLDYDPDDN